MPFSFHILNDDSCRRRARSSSPDRTNTAGKNASSAPKVVAPRLPLFMSAWPYHVSASLPCSEGELFVATVTSRNLASARYVLIAFTLSSHIFRQSSSLKSSQHFRRYS